MMDDSMLQVPQNDFFISYANADRAWAEWIAWQLENADISTILPPAGLSIKGKFAKEVPDILKQARCILVILSRDYLYMLYSQLDWALLFRQEAAKNSGLLLLVHVQECRNALKSLVGTVDFVDLTNLADEADASSVLLAAARKKRDELASPPDALQTVSDTAQLTLIHKQLTFLKQHDMMVDWNEADIPLTQETRLPIKNLPEERNELFSDRETICQILYDLFNRHTQTAFPIALALSGLGGIGKTQIALEYAYRYAEEYQYLLWVSASSQENLINNFVQLAQLLQLRERNEQNQSEVVIAVRRWLQNNANWLLIFDNVERLETLSEFMPVRGKGHILLTTQLHDLGTIAQCITVDALGPREGAVLLLRRAYIIARDTEFDSAPEDERKLAEAISEKLGGLPLALDQAGAYIYEHACSLQQYLEDYEHQSLKLLERRGGERSSHPGSVIATWSFAFNTVDRSNPAASELLQFCAFLSPDEIPEEIITRGNSLLGSALAGIARDPMKLDDAIVDLRRYSLISRNPARETLRVHELVQTVLRETLSKEQQRLWAERVVRVIHRVFPADASDRETCDKYISHAKICLRYIERWDFRFLEAEQLLHRAGDYLFSRGRYKETLPFYQRALTVREQLFGPDDADTGTLYNDLGWLYRTLSEYEQARAFFQKALALRTSIAAQKEVAQTLSDLAWLSYNEGKYSEALSLNQQALEIRQSLADGTDETRADIATSLNNLAWIDYVLGNYDEAETLFLRTYEIRQHITSAFSYTATTLENLARLYRTQGRYQEAKKWYEEALKLRKQEDEEHPDITHSLTGLGYVAYYLGSYKDAEDLFKQALSIRERVHGPDDPRVAQIYTMQGRLYRTQGKYQEAKQKYERALAIRENRSEQNHPDVAHTLRHFARLYRSLGEYEQAKDFYLRALAILQRTFVETSYTDIHPDIAQIQGDLGRLLIVQGKYADAADYLTLALQMQEEKLGPEHPDVAHTLTCQVKLSYILGRYEEALQLSQRAYDIWINKLGPHHYYLAQILNNRGQIYVAQGLYVDAEQTYQAALEIQREALGNLHPSLAQTLNNLAQIYVITSRHERVQECLEEALAIRKAVLGEEHPYLAFSLDVRADMYLAQGHISQAAEVVDQAIALRRNKLGADHLDLANSICKRGDVYFELEEYANARLFYLWAYEVRKQRLDPRHASIADVLYRLASVYEALGDYEQADKNYADAIAIYDHLADYKLPSMAVALKQYANFLEKVGRRNLVASLNARAQSIQLYLEKTQKIPPSSME